MISSELGLMYCLFKLREIIAIQLVNARLSFQNVLISFLPIIIFMGINMFCFIITDLDLNLDP